MPRFANASTYSTISLPVSCNQMCSKTQYPHLPPAISPPSSTRDTTCRLGYLLTIDTETRNSLTSKLIPASHQASMKACNSEEHPPESAAFLGPPSSSSPKETLLGGGECWGTDTWEGVARRGGHQTALECVQGTGCGAAGH